MINCNILTLVHPFTGVFSTRGKEGRGYHVRGVPSFSTTKGGNLQGKHVIVNLLTINGLPLNS
jgi:hypothetical protein